MGSIYRRKSQAKDGSTKPIWYISYYDESGKRYREAVGTSRRKAERALRQREAEVVANKYGYSKRDVPLFEEFADYWLENYSKVQNAPSTYQDNKERLTTHLIPFFERRKLDRIRPVDIDEYIASKSGELKPGTINRTLSILSKMYNDGIRWGVVQHNPMRDVRKLNERQDGFSYLSDKEAGRLLRELKAEVYPIVATALYTGMRAGEIYGLKWKNVDLEREIITVESSRDGPTKSRKVRHIPINRGLERVLRDQEKRNESEYVFPGENGEMHYRDMRKGLATACKKAGLKRIRFHDLRHTFASIFIQKSGNILSLQKLLGHSNLEMTMRYAHLAPDFLRKEMELIEFD